MITIVENTFLLSSPDEIAQAADDLNLDVDFVQSAIEAYDEVMSMNKNESLAVGNMVSYQQFESETLYRFIDILAQRDKEDFISEHMSATKEEIDEFLDDTVTGYQERAGSTDMRGDMFSVLRRFDRCCYVVDEYSSHMELFLVNSPQFNLIEEISEDYEAAIEYPLLGLDEDLVNKFLFYY